MNCDEVEDILGAYALDALPGELSADVTAHLATCSKHPEAAELRAVAGALAFAAPEAQPSAALKTRLLEAGIPFPRIHDLPQLLNVCLPVEPLWSGYAKVVDAMTDYAVDFRYPGHAATLRAAKLALKHCRSLRMEARHALGLKK